jgi:thiosulfate reductase cytochrome b subunit
MKVATQRKVMRWLHIIASIPLIGYIYGPVKNIPNAVFAIKWVLLPLIVLTGLWMWKGHLLRKSKIGTRKSKVGANV